MSWPTNLPNSAAFDADADSVAASRPELKKMSDAVNTMASNVYTAGSTTGTITPDVANGEIQRITLTGNITMNAFANPVAGQRLTMIFKQPASGSTFNLTSTMLWENGLESLTQINGAVDTADIFYDGTNYFARMNVAHGSVEVYPFESNFTVVGDDSSGSLFELGNTLKFAGSNGATVSVVNDVVTISGATGLTNPLNTDFNLNGFKIVDSSNSVIIRTLAALRLQRASNNAELTFSADTGNCGIDSQQGNLIFRTNVSGSVRGVISMGSSGSIDLNTNTLGTRIYLDNTGINVTSNGNVNFNDAVVTRVELKDYHQTVFNKGALANGNFTLTVANGNVQRALMNNGATVSFAGFTDARDGQTVTLILQHGAGLPGFFGEALDSANRILFEGGSTTLSNTINAIDIVTISYFAGTYFARISKGYA